MLVATFLDKPNQTHHLECTVRLSCESRGVETADTLRNWGITKSFRT